MKKHLLFTIVLGLCLFNVAFSLADNGGEKNPFYLEPVNYIYTAGTIVLITIALAVLKGDKMTDQQKKFYFLLITIPVVIASAFIAIHTVVENIHSTTKGPVHWHFDYQVWVCDERLDLVDPKGLKNKIGTPLLHEHNDDRAHVEGTVKRLEDVNLGNYFRVIGGHLSENRFVYNDKNMGLVQVNDGDTCAGQPSYLKVYVNGQRIQNPELYIMYPHAMVPPGDCIIIEFSPGQQETTTRLCESWQVAKWDYTNYEHNRGGN